MVPKRRLILVLDEPPKSISFNGSEPYCINPNLAFPSSVLNGLIDLVTNVLISSNVLEGSVMSTANTISLTPVISRKKINYIADWTQTISAS